MRTITLCLQSYKPYLQSWNTGRSVKPWSPLLGENTNNTHHRRRGNGEVPLTKGNKEGISNSNVTKCTLTEAKKRRVLLCSRGIQECPFLHILQDSQRVPVIQRQKGRSPESKFLLKCILHGGHEIKNKQANCLNTYR